jgi:uncharacterized protein
LSVCEIGEQLIGLLHLLYSLVSGASAAVLLLSNGDIMGISGIMTPLLHPFKALTTAADHWKLVYLGSFLLTVHFTVILLGDEAGRDGRLETSDDIPVASTIAHVLGGFLVGFGTKLGNGCTTGHGICGVSRLSKRSIVSVLTFAATGMATATMLTSPKTPWAESTRFLRTDSLPTVSKALGIAVTAAGVGLALVRQTGDATNNTTNNSPYQRKAYAAAVSGALFAVGLAVCGMTKKSKVHGFLDVGALYRSEGTFDPTLITVLGSAIFVSGLGYQYLWRQEKCQPACGCGWSIPTNTAIDAPLILGAALFGIGWGLTGLCPGPAVFAAAAGVVDVVLAWCPAFLVGTYLGLKAKGCGCPPKAKTL